MMHGHKGGLQIPKRLHIIWVGDEKKRPDQWIQTWRDHHPDWDVKVWGNDDYQQGAWINQKHLESLWKAQSWIGVSNLLRLEILYKHGGIYVDADSICLRPLDDWILESEFFACWANDIGPQKRINNAFMGSVPDNPFLRFVIDYIRAKRNVTTRMTLCGPRPAKTWKATGVMPLNICLEKLPYTNATLLPCHMFHPRHRLRKDYAGGGRVYADHLYAGTSKLYSLAHP